MLLKVNTKPSARDLRWFGVTILIAFSLLAALLYWRGKVTTASWMWAISVPIGLLAIVLPPAARLFYIAWMSIAVVMGTVMSRLIMSLLYFLLITPVSLFFRLTGRDVLRVHKKDHNDSYWQTHKQHMDERFYRHLY